LLIFIVAIMPGLPMFPFTFLRGIIAFAGYAVPKQLAKEREEQRAMAANKAEISKQREARESVKESMKSAEIELCLGK
jgi:flagellar biosynthesis protein FlhA